MLEIKEILEKLSSAFNMLQEGITRTTEKEKKQNSQQVTIDDGLEANKVKAQKLEEREAKVRHIEDIDKTSKESASSLAQVRQEKGELQVKIEQHQSTLTKDKQDQKIEWDKIDTEKAMAKKQATAIKEERATLDEQKKEFAVKKKVDAEMSK